MLPTVALTVPLPAVWAVNWPELTVPIPPLVVQTGTIDMGLCAEVNPAASKFWTPPTSIEAVLGEIDIVAKVGIVPEVVVIVILVLPIMLPEVALISIVPTVVAVNLPVGSMLPVPALIAQVGFIV